MRVLFTSWAWPSHLYAMVPLAWATRAAGHSVMIACQPALLDTAARTGLTAVRVGYDVDSVDMVRGYVLPTRRFGAAQTSIEDAGSDRVPRALRMFLANAEAMVDDLVQVARSWRPDLVVHDPTAWSGTIAAAAIEVPAVRHLYGADLMYRARHMVAELLVPMGKRHGLNDLDPMGAATIDPFPASAQFDVDYPKMPIRYMPFNGAGTVPASLLDPPARPRVCVTWGTTMSRVDPQRFLAGEAAAALGDLDVEVVAAVTAEQHKLLEPLPDNVRIIEDTPLHAVLPSCDLLIAHGGAGTMLTGLVNGLPQLLVPQLPDHKAHSTQLVSAGAATLLPLDEATPAQLRENVLRLLHDTDARRAAKRLQQEIAEQPEPSEVVMLLEDLAAD